MPTLSLVDDTQPLVISSYSLGTRVPFGERVRIAAGAGFAGIGLRVENYWDARRAGLDDAAMLEILDRNGIAVMEVEYVTGWGTPAARDGAQRRRERAVFAMARTFGVRHLNAGLLERLPIDVVTVAFADLCRRAGELTVGLEFMPYSGIADLPTAWAVVEAVVAVQLCDVLAEPLDPPRAESLGHRLPPGRGHGDVIEMVRALKAKGVRPRVVSVEVISDELVSGGLETAAAIDYAAARELLTKAR